MSKDLLIGLHHLEELPEPAPANRGESLSYKAFTREDVARFAKWNPSETALDLVARRFTAGACDWNALRAAFLRAPHATSEATLALFTTPQLFTLWDAMSSSGETDLEVAIAQQIAHRHVSGDVLNEAQLSQLSSSLLSHGCLEDARRIAADLEPGTWSKVVATAELAHPRFGGSYDAVLESLNEAYTAVGMTAVSLIEGPGTPFSRLTSTSEDTVHGPLVSIVMSAWRPGEEIFTAVRSVIDQTYQDWELLVTDDASGPEYDEVFSQLSMLDSRVHVIRNDQNAGTYVRRNEALRGASGEFVTFHDSDDWSHPQRIEMQVSDLAAHPGRIGNIVRHARTTEDLSFATNRGTALTLTEPAIMFRRKEALAAAGFYDAIRKGADREYRLRLEAVTDSHVALIGPMAPLQLMLASPTSLSGSDFGPGWMTPARVAYRTAVDRYHEQIRAGFAEGRIAFPQPVRRFVAPPDLAVLGGARELPITVDILVIADGQPRRNRDGFLRQIALEMREAAASGLSVALLHSDSLGARRGGPRLAPVIQTLIDEQLVHQVFEDQPVDAGLAVIRHATAAQGHSRRRRPVTTPRALIVEDPSGGDVRQKSFTPGEVKSTVASWLGVEPSWSSREEANRLASLSTRATLPPQVLAAFAAPGSQLKYEDQSVALAGRAFDARYQRTFRTSLGADIVVGTDSLDTYLGLDANTSTARRLERTKRFVEDLRQSRVGLVRVLVASPQPAKDPRLAEARALLDAATTKFIINDVSVETPDLSRTVHIPSADPAALFVGYPVSTRQPGRLLCISRDGSDALARSAMRTFFLSRVPHLSLRVVGSASATLSAEFASAARRTPRRVTQRFETLSDAALVEELTAAELVMISDLTSPADYQLAMMALALGTPVLTPGSAAALSLRRVVGDDWVIALTGKLTAEHLDEAVTRSRRRKIDSSPDLSGRDFYDVGARYARILCDVSQGIRRTTLGATNSVHEAAAADKENRVKE